MFLSFLFTVRIVVTARYCFYTCLSFCSQSRHHPLADTHPLADHTPWQTHPLWADTPWQTPLGRHFPGRHTPLTDAHPWQTHTPLADTHPPLGRHTPWQTPPLWQTHPLLWQTHPLGRHPLADTPPWQTPLGRHPPPHRPRRDGHCSSRYASYWNAFLFSINCSLLPTSGFSRNQVSIILIRLWPHFHWTSDLRNWGG